MNPLAILFAGSTETAVLLNDTILTVHVRALPQRHLHHVLATAEHKHALVELVTYQALPAKPKPQRGKSQPKAKPVINEAYPEIPVPDGYAPVPLGWTDNLTDESIDKLYDLAKTLNFTRAAKWAGGQIAAKQLLGPLHAKIMAETLPVIEAALSPLLKRLEALSSSMPTSPPAPAASTAKSS